MQEFEKTLKRLGDYRTLSEDAIKDASKSAHVSTNQQLHATTFDDTLSGTTAISVLLKVTLAHCATPAESHKQPRPPFTFCRGRGTTLYCR